jgi:hypothetical protein
MTHSLRLLLRSQAPARDANQLGVGECLLDQVRPAVARMTGKPLAYELRPACLQGDRPEVPDQRMPIEAIGHLQRQANHRDLIGHFAVLDVVLFTVAEVCQEQLDDRQGGGHRGLRCGP